MVKRIIVFLLCVCLLIPLLVSCANSDEGDETTATVESTESNGQDIIPDNVGDARFDGQEIIFAVRSGELYEKEFFATYTSAVIDKAVYEREVNIETRLGVSLDYVHYDIDEMPAKISNSILSGDDEIQIIANYAYDSPTLVTQGLLKNVYDVPYVMLEHPWYNQDFNQNTTVNGRLFQITGDISLSSTEYIVGMYVNLDLAKEYGINANLYGVVEDGEWTLGYLKNIIKNVYSDVDGMGTKDPDDVYGMIIGRGSPPREQLLFAAGYEMIARTPDGGLSVEMESEKSINAFNSVFDLYHNTEGVGFFEEYLYMEDIVDHFLRGNGIFFCGTINCARRYMVEADFNYGLLPLPKLDLNQQNYYSMVGDGYSQILVSRNTKNIEAVGAVIEVMGRLSYYDMRPVVFETVYKYRYFDSPEIAEIFDGIIENCAYDFGMTYRKSFNNPIHTVVGEIIKSGNNNYVSSIKTTSGRIKTMSTVLIKQLTDIK